MTGIGIVLHQLTAHGLRRSICACITDMRDEPTLRAARLDEADTIDAMMKDSVREIFPQFYDEIQTASSIKYISAVDRLMIADGTYFVIVADGDLIACGGWSRRDLLYAGSGDAAGSAELLDPQTQPARVRAMFVRQGWTRRGLGTRILEACEAAAKAEGYQRLALMATLPGLLLYERYGFQELERVELTLVDGVKVPAASMEKPIN